MKRKPIRVDWDELEVAFTNQNEELVYYLDLITGHVVIEGEGEEDDFDDEDDYQHPPPPPQPQRDDSTRAYVVPMDVAMKIEWMQEFVGKESQLDAEVVAALKEALASDDAAVNLREYLNDNADARDLWYLYRSDRLHDHIEAWLEQHEVQPVDPPPWE